LALVRPEDVPSEARVRRPRKDATLNRERVLQAAEAVFAESGLHASTDEVARRAGVGVATVFRHFATKEALVQALLERHQERLLVELRPCLDQPDPALGLAGFFQLMMEQARAKKVLVQTLEQAGIDFKKTGVNVSSDLRRALDHLLIRAQQAGSVRPDVNGLDAWVLLTGLCQSALGPYWSDEVQSTMLNIVLRGLMAGEGSEDPAHNRQ